MERTALKSALQEQEAAKKYAAELLDRYKATVILACLHPALSDQVGGQCTLSELRAKIERIMDHEAHSNGPADFWFDFLRGRWFGGDRSCFERSDRPRIVRSCVAEAVITDAVPAFCQDTLGIASRLFGAGRGEQVIVLPDHADGDREIIVVEPSMRSASGISAVTARPLTDAVLCSALLRTWKAGRDVERVKAARQTLIELFWRVWDACVSEADECARNNTCLYEEDEQVTCSCPHVTLILSDRPRDFRILQGSQFGDGLYAPQRVCENGKRLEQWLYGNILPEYANFSRCCESDHLEQTLTGRGWPLFRPQHPLKVWIHLGMMELGLRHALLCGKTLLVILPREITVLPNEVSLFRSA